MTHEFRPFAGEQIRAARAMARLEQSALAEAADLSLDTIKRIEGVHGPVQVRARAYRALIDAFRRYGVELDCYGDGRFGVRRVLAQSARHDPDSHPVEAKASSALSYPGRLEGRELREPDRERQAFAPAVHSHRPDFDSSPGTGIAYWDRAQTLRFANQAYLDWFGRQFSDVAGLPDAAVLGPDTYQANEVFIQAALEGEQQSFERTLKSKDGALIHLLVQYIPRLSTRGEVIGYWDIVTDITALKEAELRLAYASAVVAKERLKVERASHLSPDAFESLSSALAAAHPANVGMGPGV